MKAYFSLGNFNNQTEFNRYMGLDILEQAEDDYIMDLDKIEVGYDFIVLYPTGYDKQVIRRKEWLNATHSAFVSLAINEQAMQMHGEGFKRFTATQDPDGMVRVDYRA